MGIVTLAYHQMLSGKHLCSLFFTILTGRKIDGLAIVVHIYIIYEGFWV